MGTTTSTSVTGTIKQGGSVLDVPDQQGGGKLILSSAEEKERKLRQKQLERKGEKVKLKREKDEERLKVKTIRQKELFEMKKEMLRKREEELMVKSTSEVDADGTNEDIINEIDVETVLLEEEEIDEDDVAEFKGQKLIIVANRLPVSVSLDEHGEVDLKMSSGGLVSALLGVRGIEMVWLGWPGKEVPEKQQPKLDAALKEKNCAAVYLDDETVDLYYNGFSNNVLWPLFHYIPLPLEHDADHSHKQWLAYQRANHLFSEKVLEVAGPNDVVWVHDYHLMLMPEMLRKIRANMRIGWFLHTPFPSSEIYRGLSYREEILRGVLSADLVGFHTYDYARHFVTACTRILGLENTPYGIETGGSVCRVGTFPIGIEPYKFLKNLKSTETKQQFRKLREQFKDKIVILGIDRCDMIKGLPQKLLAFEKFLADNPQHRDQIVLVQIAVPSRIHVPEYQKLRSTLHELVGRINGKYGSVRHVPIHYLDTSIPFHEMCALYKLASICLITSVRDGMNLVSYEYVACQQGRHGVLVLSEFAGAAQSLGAGALLVNPWNISDVAAAIETALDMDIEERKERHDYTFNYILNHTAQHWASNFTDDLNDTREQAEELEASIPKLLDIPRVVESYKASKSRLIILGLNGTLAAVPTNRKEMHQQRGRLSHSISESLAVLSKDPHNMIVIVSSASREQLDRVCGHLNIGLAAENGLYFRAGNSTNEWVTMVDGIDISWLEGVKPVFDYFAERTPGSYVEIHETSVVWNYRNVLSTEFGRLQARDMLVHLCAGPLNNAPAELFQGIKSLEVRSMGVTKGAMLEKIAAMMVQENRVEKPDFALCVSQCLEKDEDLFTIFTEPKMEVVGAGALLPTSSPNRKASLTPSSTSSIASAVSRENIGMVIDESEDVSSTNGADGFVEVNNVSVSTSILRCSSNRDGVPRSIGSSLNLNASTIPFSDLDSDRIFTSTIGKKLSLSKFYLSETKLVNTVLKSLKAVSNPMGSPLPSFILPAKTTLLSVAYNKRESLISTSDNSSPINLDSSKLKVYSSNSNSNLLTPTSASAATTNTLTSATDSISKLISSETSTSLHSGNTTDSAGSTPGGDRVKIEHD